MEDIDLVRLLHSNKKFRATLLKHNPQVFTSQVYCSRINSMLDRLDEWQARAEGLQRAVTLFEAKDKARNQLLQNVNDQRLRSIIEKHIIRPALGQSQF